MHYPVKEPRFNPFQKGLIFLIAFVLALFLLALIDDAKAQTVDTIIHTPIYTSYFDTGYKEPLYVVYKIYKAPLTEENSRAGLTFKNDIKGLKTARAKDYAGSGYDEGHMAPCQDFSNNVKNEELTFRFYNCLPQLATLNRGNWKAWEITERRVSQTDSLEIICGGVNYTHIGSLWVPAACWKIVKSLTTGNVLFAIYDDNNGNTRYCEFEAQGIAAFYKLIPYKIKGL